jgi:L-fuculose-phosphate aldolase
MKNGTSKWHPEKKQVLEAARLMAEKGLVVGTSGNVSMRIESDDGRELMAITPNALYYDRMEVDDIVVADFEGENVEGELRLSIEKMLHIGIYKARKKVNAVIHSHPIFGNIVSVAGLEIPEILDDQVTYLGGEIKLAKYAIPGTADLVESALEALGPRNGALLANHGAVSIGRDMKEAFVACELLERTSQIYVFSMLLVKVVPLPEQAQAVEKAYFNYLHGEETQA